MRAHRTILFPLFLLFPLLVLPGSAAADGGKKEVRVLSDRTESHLAPLFAAYEKETGVKVTAVYLDKGLISRLESRPTEADLVITKDADLLEIAKQKHLLQRFSSAVISAAVPKELVDADGMYFTDSYRARAIYYSKDRVKPSELSTYEALADKKWHGRVCIRSGYHDYNLGLFGQMMAAYGEARTRRFVEGLAANLARAPIGDDRAQVKAIRDKVCDVAIVNSYYMGIMLSSPEQRSWGLSARVYFPDQKEGGAFILRSGLALTRATANARAARALLEYLVREDVQARIASFTFAYPVHSKSPLPAITRALGEGEPGVKGGRFRIHAVSLAKAAKERDAVMKMLDEIRFDRQR
jgi:iron(III) transport system substrate-binding protein